MSEGTAQSAETRRGRKLHNTKSDVGLRVGNQLRGGESQSHDRGNGRGHGVGGGGDY